MICRTRERPRSLEGVYYPDHWVRPSPPPYEGNGSFGATVRWYPSYEKFTDSAQDTYVPVSGWPVTRKRLYKPAKHEKWSCVHRSTTTRVQLDSTTTRYDAQGGRSIQLCAQSIIGSDAVAGDWTAQRLHAWLRSQGHFDCQRHSDRWKVAKPSMASRANLFVALMELRDIKKMFDVIPKKRNLKDWNSILSYLNGSLHLNYNFGWKPFLNDVKNTFKAVAQFDERFNRLVKYADKDLRRNIGDTPTDAQVDFTEYIPASSLWRWRFTGPVTVKRGSSFDMIYQLPNYGREEMRWRAWLDTLGLNPSISDAWELVPWSFVVDWFLNVGNVLDMHRADWLQPNINLFQACETVSCHYDVAIDVLTPTTYGSVVLPAFTITGKYFFRTPSMPRVSLELGDLTADKIRLGSSLLIQRYL